MIGILLRRSEYSRKDEVGSKKFNKWNKQKQFNPRDVNFNDANLHKKKSGNILPMKKEGNNNNSQIAVTPYQYTRGIRFRADIGEWQSEAFKAKYEKYKGILDKDTRKRELSELTEPLSDFHKKLESLLYFYPENGKKEFRKGLSIDKIWLKNWHEEAFYLLIKDNKNRQGKYVLRNLEDRSHVSSKEGFEKPSVWFQKWFDDWRKYISQIETASKAKDHSQSRRSDIAESIRGLLSRRQFHYISDFLTKAHDGNKPELEEKINKLKETSKKVWDKLKEAEEKYLPAQSSGVEITKASFNYYTVNKKPKEYYEEEPQKAEKQLYKDTFSIIKKTEEGKYEWKEMKDNKNSHNRDKWLGEIFLFQSEQEIKWIEGYYQNRIKEKKQKHEQDTKSKFEGNLEIGISLSLDETYITMKAFKAEQKSIFYEIAKHIASEKRKDSSCQVGKNHILDGYKFPYEKLNRTGLNREFSLFKFENKSYGQKKYDKFIKLTGDLQKEQIPKNKTEIAKTRGKFLFGRYPYFKEYGSFCEKYKQIAQQRGRLKAQIKGIEKEGREALQTDSWSLIYCDQDKKQLWLVPKNKREEGDFVQGENLKNQNTKTNLQRAKEFIYNKHGRQDYTPGDSQYLCSFESLTMRALHKLCFAKESSFVKDMPSNLKSLQKEAEQFPTKDHDEKLKEKDHKKLIFFKKLLKDDYARQTLPVLNAFDPSVIGTLHPINKEAWQNLDKAENLEEFEKSLETACYYPKRIVFKKGEKDHFLKEYDVTVMNISSYDLEERNKKNQPESKDRYHTELWKSFWDNINKLEEKAEVQGFSVGNIRLNPEIKIRWREADKNLENYFKKRDFPKKFKHRRLQDQFTVHFTLALHAGKKYEDLAFSKPEELLKEINKFNGTLNKEEMNFETAWKYGIDRGQKELSTLCLVKFDSDKSVYQVNGKDEDIQKPEFAEIECYTLKDHNFEGCISCGVLKIEGGNHNEGCSVKTDRTEWRSVIKNLSYFMNEKYLNDERFFKKEKTSCLDLTAAKVIKGKIVTNGDVMTFLKLKKAVAKRRLYDLHYEKGLKEDLKWNDKNELRFHISDTGQKKKQNKQNEKPLILYRYDERYEGILLDSEKNIKYNKNSIESSLNHYLNELRREDNEQSSSKNKRDKEDHTPTILQINHLRDALTANMVGVISHLQKKCPGFIVLEDLDKDNLEEEFFKNNIIVHRKLENALYTKFQSLGLVPPHVKDIIKLRENVRERQKERVVKSPSSQIGVIVFVKKEDTSRDCPYCSKPQDHRNEQWRGQWKQKCNGNKMDWYREVKGQQKRFICAFCDFDTYLFKDKDERVQNYKPGVNENNKEKFHSFKHINDPDKVAAYNIAKKIKRSEDIGKMELDD